MSRDFKREYTSYLDQQAPDLWDRIEAGLCSKSMAVAPAKGRFESMGTGKRRRPGVWAGSLTAAAAVLLCVVASSTYLGRSFEKAESDGMAQLQLTADMVMPELKKEDACLEVADEEQIIGTVEEGLEQETPEQKVVANGAVQEKSKAEQTDGLEKNVVQELQASFSAKVTLVEVKAQEGEMYLYLARMDGREIVLACPAELAKEYKLSVDKTYRMELEPAAVMDAGQVQEKEYDYLIKIVVLD